MIRADEAAAFPNLDDYIPPEPTEREFCDGAILYDLDVARWAAWATPMVPGVRYVPPAWADWSALMHDVPVCNP